MKPILLIYILLTIISCKEADQTEKENNIQIKGMDSERSFDFKNHSLLFNKTLDLLKKESYRIEAFGKEFTEFTAYEGSGTDLMKNEMVKKISVPNIKKVSYKVKRVYPIVKGGNSYVRFNITELYFDNDSIAERKKLEIDSIINFTDRIDLFNDKYYDYTIQNSNRIIYIGCDSMFDSYSSDSLKPKIEKLIN